MSAPVTRALVAGGAGFIGSHLVGRFSALPPQQCFEATTACFAHKLRGSVAAILAAAE